MAPLSGLELNSFRDGFVRADLLPFTVDEEHDADVEDGEPDNAEARADENLVDLDSSKDTKGSESPWVGPKFVE